MEQVQLSFESGESSLSVRRFRIEEGVSRLFQAQVVARSPHDDLSLGAQVGRPAGISIWTGVDGVPSQRRLRGLCTEMRMVRTAEAERGLTTYELTLAPFLWKLGQRVNNRLFQHVSIPDIADELLSEWGIERSFRLDRRAYPPLELRAQYGETDYAFLSRLLEEAGISFFFTDEGEQGSTLVLCDAPQLGEPRHDAVPFVEDATQALAGRHGHVTRVELCESARIGRVTVRDHDFRNPRFPLFGVAELPGAAAAYERYRYEPGAALRERGGGLTGDTVADDLGVARSEQDFLDRRARVDLEGALTERRRVSFETSVSELSPGTVFSIAGHPRADLAVDQRLLVSALVMEGEIPAREGFSFRAEAVFAADPFRPRRATPKPRIAGVQSAVVVGERGAMPSAAGGAPDLPATERLVDNDIYCDEHGRVRVQFPWDREGSFDEHSSIWLRVSQGWAGGGYGLFTLPRVGHEVLVAFLDGDPDCPVVVGRLHDIAEPLPFPLPENRTVSTFRTASSPGGEGHNELRFDDATGREHLYMQAEKDMDRLVKNDLKEAVGRDHTRFVQSHDALAVGHDRAKMVNHNEVESTGLNHVALVGLSRVSTVGIEDSTVVGTRWSVTVARGLSGRLSRELGRLSEGPLGDVLARAARGVLGLIPESPVAGVAGAALGDFGRRAVEGLTGLVATLEGQPAEPGPPPTTIEVVDRQIKLSTGEATILLDGPNITISAQGAISMHAVKGITVLGEDEVAIAARAKLALVSATDDVIVQARRNVHLNPYRGEGELSAPAVMGPAAPGLRCPLCGSPMLEGPDGPACPDHPPAPTTDDQEDDL